MTNPLKIGGQDGDFVLLDPGTYEAVLESIELKQFNKWQSDELEDKLQFSFAVNLDDGSKAVACSFPRPIISKTSNAWRLLKAMGGKKITESWLTEADHCWKFFQSCIGQTFIISIEHSKSGEYNRLVSVIRPPETKAPSKIPTQGVIAGTSAPKLKTKVPYDTGMPAMDNMDEVSVDLTDSDDIPY